MLVVVKLTVHVYAETLSEATRKVEDAIQKQGEKQMWIESIDKSQKAERQ